MNAFSKITVALATSAALFLTFSCSSGGGGGGESPEDGISSSSVGVSSSSEVPSSSSGVTVVKATLIAEIATAETAKESAEVSVDGSDVNPTDFWVTQAEMTALTTAITTAETVKNNESATQAQVDAAKATLTTAIATFAAAKKAGTNPGAAVKHELEAELVNAETAKNGIIVATNADNVVPSASWVTQAAMTALENAITTAEGVKDDGSVTQAQVDAAKATLQAAITAFNSAKQTGAETTAAKAELTAKIADANSAKAGVETATNGASLFTSDSWVTSAQMTAITTAIATATTANTTATTKKRFDDATAALTTAISTFTTAKQAGTVPLCDGNKYDLATKFCDTRDDKLYNWVDIGQIWMAENLNYEADGSKCYDNDEDNCDTYGRLYNWSTAMANVCPAGWHLPSDAEWDVLMASVGGDATTGTKLKAAEGWNSYGVCSATRVVILFKD